MSRARLLGGAGAGFAVAALVYAIAWLEHQQGLEPCPLCVVDRIALAAVAVVFAAAALHDPGRTGRRIYGALALLPLALGLASAGRHVWLQSLPADQVPACGPSLGYMLEQFPLSRVTELVLRGSGSCAEVQWRFLGLSLPAWTLALFIALTLVAVALIGGPRPRERPRLR